MNFDWIRNALGPGAELVDFAARFLPGDATLREARQFLAGTGSWGVPLVDEDANYVGMLTLRSMVAAALPVALGGGESPGARIPPARPGRLERDLDRPARDVIDLEVPVVRLSTRLPQLISALCRRSPVLPIVSDAGMRFLGIASLERAAHALYSR